MQKALHPLKVFVLCGSLLAGAAHAELVTNGSFQTGDFSGWTRFGAQDNVLVESTSTRTYAYFGQVDLTGGIFQTLDTVVGQQYDVSFLLRNYGDGPNSFEFDWNGITEVLLQDAAAFGYTQYTYSLVATTASTDLRFTFMNAPGAFHLTDVYVNAAAPTADIPEPASLGLVAAALLGACAARRRRAA